MRTKNLNQGFHLLEILATLCIIAIISSWTLSNYQRLIASEHRHEAEHALFALASAMESYAMENGTYEDATLEKLRIPHTAANNAYELHITIATNQNFIIAATPRHQQAEIDHACGTLSFTSSGEKKIDGSANLQDCW
jgi:Tfp pilus assembly protein PilE